MLSWKGVLRNTQMVGTRLVRPGHTWSCTSRILRVSLGWLWTILLRMWFFILLRHGSCLDSVFSLRNVRTCGCPRMTSRILLPGPHPRNRVPLVLLRDIHNSLLSNYDYKDTTPPQSQPDTGARVGHIQQDGDSQQQETVPLLLPQLNLTVFKSHETYIGFR